MTLADEAGGVVGGDSNDRGRGRHFDDLADVADLENEVDKETLADDEGNAVLDFSAEAGFFGADFILADGERGGGETAGVVGGKKAFGSGFKISYLDRHAGDATSGRVRYGAFDGGFSLSENGSRENCGKRESENGCREEEFVPLQFLNGWGLHAASPRLIWANRPARRAAKKLL